MGDGSGTNSYPPVGDPDRYDMIVQRGRTLRRRRRYSLGAGAGGTVVALAIAVVLITGNGSGSGNVNATELAEDPTTTTTTTEAPTTTTTLPENLTVTVDPATKTVAVMDTDFPVSDSSKQCVHLSLRSAAGQLAAELHQCNYYSSPAPGAITLDFLPAESTEIDCASMIENIDPATLPGTVQTFGSTFGYEAGQIEPGTYTLEVSATSGIGSGCAGAADQGTYEDQAVVDVSTQIELP